MTVEDLIDRLKDKPKDAKVYDIEFNEIRQVILDNSSDVILV